MKPTLPPRWSVLAALLLSAACQQFQAPRIQTSESARAQAGQAELEAQPQWPPIALFLLRHAEKSSAGGDPALNEAGAQRALDLYRMLAAAGVTHIFCSPTLRASSTAKPLAEALGLELSTYDPADMSAHAAVLRGLPAGSVAVSVGHSNTVPALAALLGAPIPGLDLHPRYGALLPEAEFDRMELLVLPGSGQGPAKRLELRYGQP